MASELRSREARLAKCQRDFEPAGRYLPSPGRTRLGVARRAKTKALGSFRVLSGYFRGLSGSFGYFRVPFGFLSGTFGLLSGYFRVLSGTFGYFRVLSGTFGYFRVAFGYFRVPFGLISGCFRVLSGSFGFFRAILNYEVRVTNYEVGKQGWRSASGILSPQGEDGSPGFDEEIDRNPANLRGGRSISGCFRVTFGFFRVTFGPF